MAAPMAQQLTPQQQNIMARQAVIRQAVDMWLPIFSQTYTSANNQGPGFVINLPPRNVGLIKRFLIEVRGHISNTTVLTRTASGGANFFSNVLFTDLSNQQRVNTTGWHLVAVSSAKRRRPFGAAAAFDEANNATGDMAGQFPFGTMAYGYGNTDGAVFLDNSVAANAGTNVQLFFEVPLAYTDHDLRGAIYANVTNATMNLQMTVNPNMFLDTNARNAQRAVYTGAAGAATLDTYTVTVYQNFLDQLPIAQQGGPVLPLLDLSTAYLLNQTAVSGVVLQQDNPIPYANFRDFMSTAVIYDDPIEYTIQEAINYWALQSANYTNIFKVDPVTNYLLSRLIIGTDFPSAMFYFDFRNKPVSTIQYGNMELIGNPNTVTDSQTAFLVGFEALALINMITQAGSLYGS